MTDTERKLQTRVNLLTTTNEVLAERLAAAETDYAAELEAYRLTMGSFKAERDVKSDLYITALEELVKRTVERDALANAPNNDLPVALLERLAATLSRLGKATPEGGIERFNADIEYQLYNLCRGVDSVISGSDALTERVKALEAAGQAVINFVEGDLPTRGWIKDCDKSRKALHELKAAIKGATT
jgi:hypothetical protein